MLDYLKKNYIITIAIIFVLVLSILLGGYYLKEDNEITYNEFLEMVKKDKVERIIYAKGENKVTIFDKEKKKKTTVNPESETFKEEMLKEGIEVVQANSVLSRISKVIGLIFNLLFIALFIFIIKSLSGTMSSKKEKVDSESIDVTFDKIKGNEAAKQDMKFMVEFLKNPEKYENMGAKLPKGVVLYGPPGTGKTLMAKAVAGEADVPFYSIAGSDFIEMYAGLGARRVRDLFKEAKKNSPSIIFIDEIDSVGTSRGNSEGNGEKDQTINALLAELDGFEKTSKVIVIAATNRIEDLDEALIRPGRFDRHVSIPLPEYEERLEILKSYAKGKPLDESINLDSLAHITIGFSGAALESLLNEAAIIAVNRGSNIIEHEDVDDSYYKIAMKGNKRILEDKDESQLELVAYHEAGHALATKLLTDNHLHKVTIIPSTSGAGGATFSVPKGNSLISKIDLINNIKVLYAGRAAEEILRGSKDKITSGASGDIQQATRYINSYFSELGMSEEFGMLGIDDKDIYIKEAVALSKKIYEETYSLLVENREMLDKLSLELIKHETLTGDQVNEILGTKKSEA